MGSSLASLDSIYEQGDFMNGIKRKIRAKELVRDLRNGMSDRQFMEKYALSSEQLRSVFRKLVDGGAIDEMELFMRTSLSDSTITEALTESRWANQELEQKSPLHKKAGELMPQRLRRRTG